MKDCLANLFAKPSAMLLNCELLAVQAGAIAASNKLFPVLILTFRQKSHFNVRISFRQAERLRDDIEHLIQKCPLFLADYKMRNERNLDRAESRSLIDTLFVDDKGPHNVSASCYDVELLSVQSRRTRAGDLLLLTFRGTKKATIMSVSIPLRQSERLVDDINYLMLENKRFLENKRSRQRYHDRLQSGRRLFDMILQ